jgi:hypothetical protein
MNSVAVRHYYDEKNKLANESMILCIKKNEDKAQQKC